MRENENARGEEVKFCKDCKWQHHSWKLLNEPRCLHPDVAMHVTEFLVDGNPDHATRCRDLRIYESECGREGKRWEAK